jgi:kynurenine formamidase
MASVRQSDSLRDDEDDHEEHETRGLMDDDDMEEHAEDSGEVNAEKHMLRLCTIIIYLLAVACSVLGGLLYKATRDLTAAGDLYVFYDDALKDAKYIDMTHAFSPKIPVWEGFGAPSVQATVAGKTMKGFIAKGAQFSYAEQGFIATSYVLTTDQLGTQLDPPAHWNEYGATISDIPPTVAVRPLVVVDISKKTKHNPGYQASIQDVLAWEKRYQQLVPAGSVVFFRSDWSKGWEDMASNSKALEVFPGVELETLKFLHLERKILFHGHEPLDTDTTPTLEGEAWLMHNNFAQAEGIAHLDLVAPQGQCAHFLL